MSVIEITKVDKWVLGMEEILIFFVYNCLKYLVISIIFVWNDKKELEMSSCCLTDKFEYQRELHNELF